MKENITYITTLQEAKNYIGKLVVCYYYKNNKESTDMTLFRPNEPKENIAYMWIMKLAAIPQQVVIDNSIRGKTFSYEKQYICLINNTPYGCRGKTPFMVNGCEECSAQTYMRTPTKDEINIYMNFLRHKRIFGI